MNFFFQDCTRILTRTRERLEYMFLIKIASKGTSFKFQMCGILGTVAISKETPKWQIRPRSDSVKCKI